METLEENEEDFTMCDAGCTQYELSRSVAEACNKFLKSRGDPFAGMDMRQSINVGRIIAAQKTKKKEK
jgi:hypothetical protein